MTNPSLPQQSVPSSADAPATPNSKGVMSRANVEAAAAPATAAVSAVVHREPSLSPATKSRTTLLPRAKNPAVVSFGPALATASAQAPTSGVTVPTAIPATSNRSKQRPFRSILNNNGKTSGITRQWVTREIAALEFLQMGIPMAKEGSIVHEGWTRQRQRSQQFQNRAHWLDQSREFNHTSAHEETPNAAISNDEEKQEEEDTLPPISPSLLPLERASHESPNPAVAKQGRWWEKWIVGQNTPGTNQQQQQHQAKGVNVSRDSQIEDLEEPNIDLQQQRQQQQQSSQPQPTTLQQQQPTLPSAATIYAPGRRLEGDPATKVQIPLANTLQNNQGGPGIGSNKQRNSDIVSLQLTKQQAIARMAIAKEWEQRVAHGLEERHHHDHLSPQHQHRQQNHNPAMLDGRMYMSAKESYPMMVFSLLRYEPKKEEALRRRQKLEERGGGGTQFFIMPSRDWRGISFRALLPIKAHKVNSSLPKTTDGSSGTGDREENVSGTDKRSRLLFDRFAAKKTGLKENFTDADAKEDGDEMSINPPDVSMKDAEDEDIGMEIDSDDEEGMADDTYVAGLLDDPGMVQGRHRNVMIGDRGTGPIVSSTIQFVKPKLLKADLNQQFRERFDGYEPPISQRKFIGAKVVDGIYTLMDPTQEKGVEDDDGSTSKKNEDGEDDTTVAMTVGTTGTPTTGGSNNSRSHRKRQGSTSSISLSTVGGGSTSMDGGTGEGPETIRMPPSLTLSKIRSLKQQALAAAVRAKLEISTVALAIIYFERLCLDCRVDKSNRRLSFAACLLLAIKINEAHVGVVTTKAVPNPPSSKKSRASQRIQSLIRPSKKSSTMFASLLEFFTQEWNISLKHLFAAEWGVFAALQFRLKAKPSDVAFHFRRLMKTLGYDPRRYLGSQVYGSWQQALAEEEFRRQEWEARVEILRQRKEKKKLKQLQREIEEAADRRGDISDAGSVGEKNAGQAKLMEAEDTLDEQTEITPRSPMNVMTRRRLGLGDIFKTRIDRPKRSESSERSWTKRRGSGDTATLSIKNNPTPAGTSRHRPRPPLLRPLSKSKSMLSLSAKSSIDEMSENQKSEIFLDDLEEESDGGKGRQRSMSVDEEKGIII